MKIGLSLITTFLILTGCSEKNKNADNSNAQDTIVKVELTAPPITELPPALPPLPDLESEKHLKPRDKKIISVSDTIYFNDTLKIKLKPDHGHKLGILTPENKYFFIIYDYYDGVSPKFVDSEDFPDVESLEIIPKITKALWWGQKTNKNENVFTSSGSYKIVMDNHDDDWPVETARFYYSNTERTK